MTHRITDVQVIDNFRVKDFVSKLDEWDKEEGETTNSSVKISDFKFDQRNFTTFNDKLVTLLLSTYGCRNCTLEYVGIRRAKNLSRRSVSSSGETRQE